jgi:hypothetical protein
MLHAKTFEFLIRFIILFERSTEVIMLRLSFALVAVFATLTNGYRFVPTRGGPVVDDPASSFVPESPEEEYEEPVLVAPAAIVQLGPRPYYLVDSMKPSFLKDELSK